MINITPQILFEQSINLFDNILILLFPTLILEIKNKYKQIPIFIICLLVLMVTINSYYILGVLQNIIAILVVYIYSLLALKGKELKKIAICTISVFSLGITTVPLIFLMSLAFGIETDVVFQNSTERLTIILLSRVLIFVVMFTMFYFTKKKGNLNQIQWLIMSFLFLISDFCNSLVLSYTSLVSIPVEHQHIFLGISSGVFFIAIIGFIVFSRISNENAIKTENEILLKERAYQERNIETIRLSNEEISHLKHDFKNYILIIEKFIEDNDCQNALEECKKITGKFDNIITLANCNPKIIALIINEKIHECKALNIDIKCKIIQDITVLDDTDFIIVFTNLIDNAIEHCSILKENERKIVLEIYEKMGYIVLKIENKVAKTVEDFKTTKKDKQNHGIGHKSIQKILKNADGDIKYSMKDDFFVAEALFKKK